MNHQIRIKILFPYEVFFRGLERRMFSSCPALLGRSEGVAESGARGEGVSAAAGASDCDCAFEFLTNYAVDALLM